MKILHLITTIERGGAENQLLLLAEKQVEQGYEVSVIFLKGQPELKSKLENSGIKVNGDLANICFAFQILKLRRMLERDQQDIIHCHLPRAEILSFLAHRKTPYIISRHNSEPFFPDSPDFVSVFLSRFVSSRAVKVIAISEGVRSYLEKNREISFKKRVDVIYYGINLQNRTNGKRKIRKKIHRILCVARLTKQKNIETLILAFSMYSELNDSVELLIVGRGSEEKYLRALAVKCKIQNKVKWISHSENVLEIMKECDFFILPSKYEGFGLVLLEAMKVDLPIICSDIPTSREILGDDYLGFFEKSSPSKLFDLLLKFENLQIRERSIKLQRRELLRFSIEKSASQISSIYEDVLKGIKT